MGKIQRTGSSPQQPQVHDVESAQNSTPPSTPTVTSGGFHEQGGTAPLNNRDVGRRVVEHRVEGQVRQGDAHAQLQAAKQTKQLGPASPTQQQESQAADAMNHGNYSEASRIYGELASQGGMITRDHFRTLRNQATVCDHMSQALQAQGGSPVHHPPTEQDVTSYFATLRGHPTTEVQQAYNDYASAYYVHTGDQNLRIAGTDVVYDQETHHVRGHDVVTNTPEDWDDISSARTLDRHGRRILDCEGFAYLGERCLTAAGFDRNHGRYTAMNVAGVTPEQAQQNPNLAGHTVYTADRTVDGHTDVVMISNGQMTISNQGGTAAQRRAQLTQQLFQTMYGAQTPVFTEGREAWQVDQ